MLQYIYEDITVDGVYIDPLIQTDITVLFNFLHNLETVNKCLIGMNSMGIVIDDIHDHNRLEDRVYQVIGRMDVLETDLNDLKFKIDFPITETLGQEITDEFFLFADLLPEHIKKELKIYKK